MKILAIIKKALFMQMRDYWALLLTISSAPFFILIYYLITSGGSTSYHVACIWNDAPLTAVEKELQHSLNSQVYQDGSPVLRIDNISDTVMAKQKLSDRKLDVLVLIPAGFADSVRSGGTPAFRIYGDASNPRYSVGMIFMLQAIDLMLSKHNTQRYPYAFEEIFLGNTAGRTEFEVYVPGILVFSIIMLLLSASLIFIRDIEDKTMLRLKISRMTVFDYLIGNTLVQWVVGILSFAVTLALADVLGFRNEGSMWLVLLVCSLTILSIIAISLLLVAFCKTVGMVMILGNFPLFILMFFSGAMLPLPRNEIFSGFALVDLLPPSHAVNALNKIFSYKAGIVEISYELVMLVVLTALYYAAGVIMFRRNHIHLA
jgi:ABC-2 type transport system permease protein